MEQDENEYWTNHTVNKLRQKVKHKLHSEHHLRVFRAFTWYSVWDVRACFYPVCTMHIILPVIFSEYYVTSIRSAVCVCVLFSSSSFALLSLTTISPSFAHTSFFVCCLTADFCCELWLSTFRYIIWFN